jgi:hypothetical protein
LPSAKVKTNNFKNVRKKEASKMSEQFPAAGAEAQAATERERES